MKLARLELTRYGAFQGRAVDVGPGLTVVYGPNESGKSTFRAALGDLLWGLPTRSHPFSFRFPRNRLLITATLIGDGAETITIRVDGRGYRDAADVTFTPGWRSGSVASREAWELALGLDLERLRDGGRAILRDGGDLAGVIFQARTGVDLEEARRAARESADRLYRTHHGAKSVAVRTALADVRRAQTAMDSAVSSAADVARLREALARARRAFDEADNAYGDAQGELAGAQVAHRVWQAVADLGSAREAIGRLEDQGRILTEQDLKAYDEATANSTLVAGQLAELDSSIASLEQRINEHRADPAVLAVAIGLDALREDRGVERDREDAINAAEAELERVRSQLVQAVAAVDPQHAVAVDRTMRGDRLVEASSDVVVPSILCTRLDREAENLRSAIKKVAIAEDNIAMALRHRPNAEATERDATLPGRLGAARQRRDRSWDEVRTPWVNGDLLDPRTRVLMSEALDHWHAETDRLADALVGQAEATGRALENDDNLHALRNQLDIARALAEKARQAWQRLLGDVGLPAAFDPDAWDDRRAHSEGLARLLVVYRQLTDRLVTERASLEAFIRRAQGVCAELSVVASDVWSAIEEAGTRVDKARANVQAANELKAIRDRDVQKRDRLVSTLAGYQAILARLSGADGVDDLGSVAQHSRALLEARRREASASTRIRDAADPGTDLEALIDRVRSKSEEDLRRDARDAEERRDAALGDRDAALQARDDAQKSLREAEKVGNAAELWSHQVESAERLADVVAEYVLYRLEESILCRVLERATPDADDSLLSLASALARRLTLGRVQQLTAEDDRGARRLRIEASGLDRGDASELSEGTADQVFLALRLAGIRQVQDHARRTGAETLPVLLDDILMGHDDDRTDAALEVLADEAASQQIIITTHHRVVADAARRVGATLATLEPLPAPDPDDPHDLDRARDGGAERPDPTAVRDWARAQGIPVGDRGRIRGWVVEAYLARDAPDAVD